MERTYTIPLRRQTQLTARTRRAKKAIATIRAFIAHHMKVDSVLVSEKLNEQVWQNGIKNPPPRVRVVALKDGASCHVRLFGEKAPAKSLEQKADEGKKEPATQAKPAEKKESTAKAAKKTETPVKKEAKPVEKKESAPKAAETPAKKLTEETPSAHDLAAKKAEEKKDSPAPSKKE